MDVQAQELAALKARLLSFAGEFDEAPEIKVLNKVWDRSRAVAKSASRSWMGYHANVYYRDFEEPPAGEHFSVEWGLSGSGFGPVNENWIECAPKDVMRRIFGTNGEAALEAVQERADRGLTLLEDAKATALSILTLHLKQNQDPFLQRLVEEIQGIKVLDAGEIAESKNPKGQILTRDEKAVSQRTWIPPHVNVESRISAAHQPSAHAKNLATTLERAAAHLSRVQRSGIREARIGTNVFIGHGRSAVWRDLKDFIKDRLRLPYDEFNRVPVAGITNIARLLEMLDAAACAFVILTAEDELADGKVQARMNVIHEVGLFQGRLGFTKAIVLLEEGCEEFSNIQGLGQIRFPKGNIIAKFEEIRMVLEREGLLAPEGKK